MGDLVKILKTEELKPGEAKTIELDGKIIAIFNINGEYFAIDDSCTHADGPLSEGTIYDYEVECPWHGARFDLKTGRSTTMPATEPVSAYEIKIQNGEIWIAKK